ncbi:FUSC family protein [Schumannella sp. 10F1B-5-1]|uniref:FUSC family protein n=1 Tax=Schumannella sp. 10F1B-5-1 TaxID=2590780 RepID=UPI0011309923|nr:FUSC family protein [Schumannella sp. 10F1B-5-1]TPW71556.1 FUSC family protein [Schumannella sp. 10F1B-5-1]
MNLSDFARSLVAFSPSPRRWPVAVQAGLSMLIPVTAFALAGHLALGAAASLGAFTAIYAGALPRRHRLRTIAFVAAGLIASAAVGALLAFSAVTSVVGVILVAGAAAWLCSAVRLGPPGPMFFVLVSGVAAQAARPADLGGAGGSGLLTVGLVALGCAISWIIAAVVMRVPRVRWQTGPIPVVRAPRLSSRADGVEVLRQVLAAAIATLVTVPFDLSHAYWSAASALAVLAVARGSRVTLSRAVHRVLGTVVGAAVFLGLAALHVSDLGTPPGLVLALVLGLLQFAVELLVVRHYALALVLITPLVLLIAHAAHPSDPVPIALQRLAETAVGAAVAVLVGLATIPLARRAAADPR